MQITTAPKRPNWMAISCPMPRLAPITYQRERERGQCIQPIYEKVRCELFITHHCHLIVNVFGWWREENAKECLGDGVGGEYPEIDNVVEQHQQ